METLVSGRSVHSPGWWRCDGDTIAEVSASEPSCGPVEDLGDAVALPGFVDLHCHGGGGASFTDGREGIEAAAAFHLSHGTTTVVASLVTDTLAALQAQLREVAAAAADDVVAGAHLEGPWLAPGRCGAHDPALLHPPQPDDVAAMVGAGNGRLMTVTLAPELPGAPAATAALRDAGVRVAVGHTDSDDGEVRAALDAGACLATHLFNAMPAIHHRQPGPVPVLLTDPRVTVELIADGVHVHPDVVGMAVAAAGPARVALVTDAIAAAGTGDGDLLLGRVPVRVRGGVARTAAGGAFAGSTLTMDAAVRFAVTRVGMGLADAAAMAATTPARVLGLRDRGDLVPGRRADVVVLSPDLRVRRVMRAGRWVR